MPLLSVSSCPQHVVHLKSNLKAATPSLQLPLPCRVSASTLAVPLGIRVTGVWKCRARQLSFTRDVPPSPRSRRTNLGSCSGPPFWPSPTTINPWHPTFRCGHGRTLFFHRPSFRGREAGQGFGHAFLSWYSTAPDHRSQRGQRPSDPHQQPERTPLSKSLTQPLAHEQVWNVPNILTFSRLFLTPVIGYLVVEGSHPSLALSLFCYAGITDLADGWIARRWKLRTVVGSVIDPMADKALMTVLTVALAAKGSLPVWLAGLILGRDIGLAISAIYYRWISLPPPKTFRRYWDFSLPSAEVRPTIISKINTVLQLALVGILMAQPILEPLLGVEMGWYLVALQYIVAATTVWSGASYIYSKDAVRILTKQKGK